MGHEAEVEELRAKLVEARQELAETRALLSATLDGFVLCERDGSFVDANPAYCAMIGYRRDELLGQNIGEIQVGLDQVQVGERLARVAREGTARFESRHRRKDGAIIELDVSVCAVGPADHRRIAAFVRDMTEQRRAARELWNSALLLEKAQELAQLGIWRWDVGDNKVSWSPQLYRIYGLDSASFGASFEAYLERVHPDDRERVQRSVMEALEKREPFTFEERIVRPNGDCRCLRSWGGVVLDDDGAPAQLFGACLDITEQVRARDELEARVAARTAELAEAKERAESADRLKSAFLAAMSHELRTPLNSILGFTGILLQGLVGELNAEQQKQLGMVQGSARHLLELINDLLDISKIEAGELELAIEPFEPKAVAERARAMIAPLADKKSLALEVRVDDSLGEVHGDPRRLEQVLLNLLSNAVKFTEEGTVRLEVESAGERIKFRVSDTGIGIGEEDLDRLFVPFQQLDSGLARRHDGTGLGLAISKRLVELMGGTVQVRSERGVGSSFEVEIPAR